MQYYHIVFIRLHSVLPIFKRNLLMAGYPSGFMVRNLSVFAVGRLPGFIFSMQDGRNI